MGVHTKPEHREHLRAQYRAAFGTWAAQVHHSRQVIHVSEGARSASKAAVDAARKAYREARNRLAEELGGTRAQAARS